MRGSIRVLHVDDDAGFADLAREHLQRADEDIDVETVTDTDEALERLDPTNHDCVVSDFDMPQHSGLELLEAVRERHPDLPFILFTGKGSEEVASEAISAGVTDYLQKGGTETYELLANRIRNAVGQREQRRRFETLTHTVPGLVYRAYNDPDWPDTMLRGDVAAITGHPADAFLDGTMTWGDLMHPADTDDVWDAVQAGVAADEPFEVTYRIETADGDIRWVWERGEAVDEENGVAILEGFITDITERKRREQALERERNRFEAVFDTVPEPAVHVAFEDDEPVVLRVNDAFADVFGYDTDAARGRPIDELIVPPSDADVADDINRTVVDTNFHQAEIVRETPTGARPFLFTAKTMDVGDGLEGVATYVDLTEQTRREAELTRQNERLDQVVSLVSHDLRNPLNVALGRVELAAEECTSEHLPVVAEALEDMAAMIDDLIEDARDED